MLELRSDFWKNEADYRCITTNGAIRVNGNGIMGAGVALQARSRMMQVGVDLEAILGRLIRERGNHVHLLEHNLIRSPRRSTGSSTATSI